MVSSEFALDLRAIEKRYGPVHALSGANLRVAPGEVHGLIGQNGAGKSTLMKILSGLEPADGGEIVIAGETVAALTPSEMLKRGIGIVYQDRMTVATFTVEEALFYATPGATRNGITINRRLLREKARTIIRRYFRTEFRDGALIGELTTAEQQIIQITRTLLSDPKILILDEPTAALAAREVDNLFEAIRAMRDAGITVIYISHYLREIRDICDRITVLRNGRDVATLRASETSVAAMTELMIGNDVGRLFPDRHDSTGEPFFNSIGLAHRQAFANVDLTVRRGEIVGITGLIGSGIKEFTRVLFGLERAAAGTMTLAGKPYRPKSPRDALEAGVALVPEDRRAQGIGLSLSLTDNIVLASLERFNLYGLMQPRRAAIRARHFISALAIKAPDETVPAATLSGGNQQKVSLAKWLCRDATLYVLDEPSVGIDVAAKAEIYRTLRDLADQGHALIVVSSDLDEIQGLSDRIVVFHRGHVALDAPASKTTTAGLLAVAAGAPTDRHP
ncbi:sugar ABC transporter ATP-binding protein [Agrobacterium sp. AGB01]|uniref:sugar ABC transporter ATP-binding protein n=1 Tax=Agrobacterium sp. AGB01 TaxID=2769302 RepID=UPI001782C698|nr:sugar ABC transporter ATP-binding protein [Agrobacterium sp. AGB01]MBD9388553.1 sugar ABC transporter ATP-binding protein [Agrobacterium sp. AGB01]